MNEIGNPSFLGQRALDPEVYLEKLSLFGRLLRQEGLDVSPNETADACRILLSVGFEDRETVRAALSTVFAKSREQQLKFNRVFDSFFLSEEAIRALDKKHTEQQNEQAAARQQAEADLDQQGSSLLFNEAQKDAYASLPEDEKERLRSLKERFIGPESRNPELYQNFIHSVFARSILEQQMMMEDAALGAAATDPEIGLMLRDISKFTDTEIPKAVSYIHDITRQINGELTQKRKKAGRDSKLDLRRTIRKGLETGGTLYRLAYKRKRSRKKQLVILCDVSASMVQFSEFVLRFIRSLDETSESSRIFLFSEGLVEADPFRLKNMDMFRDYVRQSGLYGRGTAMGRALKELNDRTPPVFSPSTMLLVVSDAKTVDEELCASEILRTRRNAGKVFWLNPIPERKWQYVRSIMAMKELVPMLSCSTLGELGAACRKLAYM